MADDKDNVSTGTPTNSVKSAKTTTKTKPKRATKVKGLVKKKVKETVSELKKVSWSPFPKVVKQTGVVITVVIVFTLILFGFDRLFSFLYTLLTKTIS